MARLYTATVVVRDCWEEDDMQGLLDTAFEYMDGVTARVAGDVTITEEEDD